jgi:phage-related minor tail protein
MTDFDDLDDKENGITALGESIARTDEAAEACRSEMDKLSASAEKTKHDLSGLERGFSGGLRKAFDGLILDGMKLSDALGIVAETMSKTVYNAAMKPVTNHIGGVLADGVGAILGGALPFADGAPFSQGRVMPFAKGGVLSGPTTFPMRGGMGLMGEAGPEAIMPLSRGSDGRLGVRAQGGKSVHVTMNIQTPDVQGFERSRGQIAARMSRALGHGNRNR